MTSDDGSGLKGLSALYVGGPRRLSPPAGWLGTLLHYPALVVAAVGVSFLHGTVYRPRTLSLRLLSHSLLIGTEQIPWRDVTLLTFDGRWLVVGTAQATWCVHVAGRSERLAEALGAAPLQIAVGRERPAWLVSHERRAIAWGLAMFAAGLAVAVGLAFVRSR